MAGYVFEAQYNDARATHPDLTDPRDIYQNINWWVFNSFGGPTLNESDIDPETGAPTVYKGHKLFNALRSGQVLTLRNGDKVERWDPNVYLQDYLYGQATSQNIQLVFREQMISLAIVLRWDMLIITLS